ncbi:MAG TPA: HEPN domain-containing protein [Candidatus Nitrosotalea sp.]|nr:HEPN domain-containing protein [Candidatus Nitrosotalea sp.]
MKGYWWFPDTPDKKLPGTLYYSPDDMHLELIGSLTDITQFHKQFEHEIILGFTTNGKPVTLYKCYTSNFSMSHPSIPTTSYRAIFYFVGMHFSKEEDIKFNQVSTHLIHFDEWMGISGFFSDVDDILANKVRILYSQPPAIKFELNEQFSITIGFGYSVNSKLHDEKEQRITQKIAINIEAKSEVSFFEFQKILSDIRQFLGLACLNPIYPLEVNGFTKSNEQTINNQTIQPQISIYFRQMNMPSSVKEVNSMHMLFTYRDTSNDVGSYFKKWFDNKKILEPIYNLYSDILYNNETSLEHKFLSLTHALEAYHRRTSDETEIDEKSHEERLKEILTAIPPKYSDWLKDELKFSNELSLRKRLDMLLKKVPFILEDPDSESKKFKNYILEVRNYLTHYSNKDKSPISDFRKLHETCERLKLLIEACLLFQLGFTDEKITLLIERSKINKGLKQGFQNA